MDDEPVRVKEENSDNEGKEADILTGQDFGGEEATTTAAFLDKREVEGLIKAEKEDEFGDGDEIIKDENETGDERRSNEIEKKYACDTCGKRFHSLWHLKRHEETHA